MKYAHFFSSYFHIGGDENNGKEWNANPTIQQFMKENSMETRMICKRILT
jgi:hexosaminidase